MNLACSLHIARHSHSSFTLTLFIMALGVVSLNLEKLPEICDGSIEGRKGCSSSEERKKFDGLDATGTWPEELVLVQLVGELELNRHADE